MDARTKIITELYQNKLITRLITKAANGKSELFEDELRSYVFLKICEMDESKLIQLNYDNELVPLICIIIKNQKTYNGAGVNRSFNYVPNRVDNEIKTLSGEAYLMDFIKDLTPGPEHSIDIKAAIDRLNWQEKEVIALYVKHGSVKEICDTLGNRNEYIVKILNSARKKIKNDLR